MKTQTLNSETSHEEKVPVLKREVSSFFPSWFQYFCPAFIVGAAIVAFVAELDGQQRSLF